MPECISCEIVPSRMAAEVIHQNHGAVAFLDTLAIKLDGSDWA